MREARLENPSMRLGVARPVATPRRDIQRVRRMPGVRGVRFHADQSSRVDRWLPLVENALTTAGYLVLTVGAVVLLFRFA